MKHPVGSNKLKNKFSIQEVYGCDHPVKYVAGERVKKVFTFYPNVPLLRLFINEPFEWDNHSSTSIFCVCLDLLIFLLFGLLESQKLHFFFQFRSVGFGNVRLHFHLLFLLSFGRFSGTLAGQVAFLCVET